MINISIDAADMPDHYDPLLNEIESVIELVLEVHMDKGDVFPEHNEPDPESETCFIGLDHIILIIPFSFEPKIHYRLLSKISFTFLIYHGPHLAFVSPPPEL